MTEQSPQKRAKMDLDGLSRGSGAMDIDAEGGFTPRKAPEVKPGHCPVTGAPSGSLFSFTGKDVSGPMAQRFKEIIYGGKKGALSTTDYAGSRVKTGWNAGRGYDDSEHEAKIRAMFEKEQEKLGSSNTTFPTPGPHLYRIEDIPNKGKGVIAACDLPAGTILAREQAVFKVREEEVGDGFDFDQDTPEYWNKYHPRILKKYEALPPAQREIFRNLSDSHTTYEPYRKRCGLTDEQFNKAFVPMKEPGFEDRSIAGIWETNFFRAVDGAALVAPLTCRLNHSCSSNALSQIRTDGDINDIVVLITRDVTEGEELTFSYTDCRFSVKQDRLLMLENGWHFNCQCEICTLPELGEYESDLNRQKLTQLQGLPTELQKIPKSEFLDKAMPWMDEQERILKEEKLWPHIRQEAFHAHSILIMQVGFKGDGIKKAADLFLKSVRLYLGEYHSITKKAIQWAYAPEMITNLDIRSINDTFK